MVAKDTQNRMRHYSQIEIRGGDITQDFFPAEGTVFYLFHPFGEDVMRKFVKKIEFNIKQRLFQRDRPLFIYYNSRWLNVFEENSIFKINKLGDFNNLPAAIIRTEYR